LRQYNKYLCIISVFLSFTGCATNKYFIPIREVDKTINVPEGSTTITPSFDASFYPGGISYDLEGVVFPQVSHGITNNLCYPLFPLPALQWAVINHNEIINDTVYMTNINLSLTGGLCGLTYTYIDGLKPSLFFGVFSKYRINNNIWCNIDLKFLSEFSEPQYNYSLLSNINIGIQISNNVFTSFSYIPKLDIYHYRHQSLTNTYMEHESRITIGFNPKYYFGCRFFAGYLYAPGRFDKHEFPVGGSIVFSW
jgi:hypothetical protein